MIRIRLQRKGRKKLPIYHIVVADSRNARDGRIIEQVGRYDNVTENKSTELQEDRILYWLETGAQPSDTVRKILRNEGLLYKRHLKMWGKTDEEIEAALTEWKSYRDSKDSNPVSRKEQQKEILAAEEREFKDQVSKQSAKAAAEMKADKEAAADEATAEEAVAEETAEVEAEAPKEEVTETEAAAEVEEAPVAEEETVVEEKATEEAVSEEKVEETKAEEVVEEKAAEPVEEETKKEEPKAETKTSGASSADMTAKEVIDHIRDTDLSALEGFIADDESRKTVIAAWESKQSDG